MKWGWELIVTRMLKKAFYRYFYCEGVTHG